MNWDAIGALGELLGSVAVVVTLLYLIRQLKSSEVASFNAAQSSIQLARIEVNNHRFDHLDLLMRANAGEDLETLEREQLRMLFANEQSAMFFTFMNFRRLGMDGSIQAYNFSRFLTTNPAMQKIWVEENAKWPPQNISGTVWRELVESELGKLQHEKAGDA